jgi:hypothetical protein
LKSELRPPSPSLQIGFLRQLRELRQSSLLPALGPTVAALDLATVDRELHELAPRRELGRVAGWGLRGELVFPVPEVLRARPMLLAYYRLMLGFSQKELYGSRYGLGPFKRLETSQSLPAGLDKQVRPLCECLCLAAAELVAGAARLSAEELHDLSLLTLGAQLRGGALNRRGDEAVASLRELIGGLVVPGGGKVTSLGFDLQNAAGRRVVVRFGSDPDLSVVEQLGSGRERRLLAIEVKGGQDVSNVHNRIGEAEKSHQKAKKDGFIECWTVLGVDGPDMALAHRESPSTDRFFPLPQLLVTGSPSQAEFLEELGSRLGLAH